MTPQESASHPVQGRVRGILALLVGLGSVWILLVVRNQVPLRLRTLFVLTLSFSIAFLITPVIALLARRSGIVDRPDHRKMHKEDTPLLGGISIYVAFVIGTLATLWYSPELKGVVYGATVIFLLGLLDDVFKLSSVVRLFAQITAATILIAHGMVVDFIPDPTGYGILEKAVTIIWIVGITNAVNFLDGLDGLCVGFGVIAAFFFGLTALLTGQYFLVFLAFSLAGGCLGFLPWNFRKGKPAAIFMGDAGSLFIGFTLASFAIMGDWAENKVAALIVPVLILFLPIFDVSMTSWFRIREGSVTTVREWLDYVGKDHFHHRLYSMGIGKRNAVWTMYTVSILLGFSAIIIRTGGALESYLALLQAVIVLAVFTAFHGGNKTELRRYCSRRNRSGWWDIFCRRQNDRN